MNTRWDQVKQILHEAADLPAATRLAYVEQASGGDPDIMAEVESLLASFDQAEAFLEDAPIKLGAFADSPLEDKFEGRWIGEYHVAKLIAQGGMGSVYLAEKQMDGVPLQVALKVIRFTGNHEYLARRFRLERQILARLAHENILRLIDGGVTGDGLPYIVTEYLDAQNLEEWLASAKPSLSTRLDLFQRICDAVAYAHRNLIVHGDLKPSNILVTRDGTAKLVDFGIARLLQAKDTTDPNAAQPTITMSGALTPWWASPEQLRGEPLSIESDCYELGRILFFILCGKPPFDFSGMSTQDILDRLKHHAPPKPSEVSGDARLAGDLDNIAFKALEFEREQRYRGADVLGNDIERHLQSRPVSARPHTVAYRLQKFVRRNRGSVVMAGSAGVALALAIATALYQAREARRNYESAREKFFQLRSLANTLVFDADDALAQLPGATPVRAKLVKSALGYLDELSRQDGKDARLKEELAGAYEKIGDILGRPGTQNLGQVGEALQSYRKSESLREEIRKQSKQPAEFLAATEHLAESYAKLSATLRATGDTATALGYERKALGMRQALYEGDPANVGKKRSLAGNLTTLSGSLSQLGQWASVIETRGEALKTWEEIAAQDPANVGDQRSLGLALARMGSIEQHENRLKDSLAHYQRALTVNLAVLARDPGNVQYRLTAGAAHTNYGSILHRLGRWTEALEGYRKGRVFYEAVTKADEREVRSKTLLQTNRVNTVRTLLSLKQTDVALKMAEIALRERTRLSALNPANAGAQGEVAEAHELLGEVYEAMRRRSRAVEQYHVAKARLQDLIAAGRANAAMKEDLARVDTALTAFAKRQ